MVFAEVFYLSRFISRYRESVLKVKPFCVVKAVLHAVGLQGLRLLSLKDAGCLFQVNLLGKQHY